MNKIRDMFFGGLVALVIGTGCTPSYNYKGEELKVVAHYPINEVVEISEGYTSTFCYPWGVLNERLRNAESAAKEKLFNYVAKHELHQQDVIAGRFYDKLTKTLYQGKVSDGKFTAKWVAPEGNDGHYDDRVCVIFKAPKGGVHFEEVVHLQ